MSTFLAWATRPNAGNWSLLNSAFYGLGMLATAALIIAAHVSAG